MNKREIMYAYLNHELILKDIDETECLDITYMLLEACLPLINKVIRHEEHEHLSAIYQGCRDEIESAMEGIS